MHVIAIKHQPIMLLIYLLCYMLQCVLKSLQPIMLIFMLHFCYIQFSCLTYKVDFQVDNDEVWLMAYMHACNCLNLK